MDNADDAYSKGGKSGLNSGSILVLASGTLKHFTFTFSVTPFMSVLAALSPWFELIRLSSLHVLSLLKLQLINIL